MKHGASPPPDELWQVEGLVEMEPFVQHYLKAMGGRGDTWDMSPGLMEYCQHYDDQDEEYCYDYDDEVRAISVPM